jgi:AmiR/NasT family two-component response regulator
VGSTPTAERLEPQLPAELFELGKSEGSTEAFGLQGPLGALEKSSPGALEKSRKRYRVKYCGNMRHHKTENLRVLIANEEMTHLRLIAPLVASLGHEVIARAVDAHEIASVTRTERPDVALVGLGGNSAHALELIEEISQEAACPVIVLLHSSNPEFVKEAAKRGVFAYVTDGDPHGWQGSIEIVLRRFAEYHDLKGAFGRRAIIERAKGILMERHGIDDRTAFDRLRDHARSRNRTVVDVAGSVAEGHALLPNVREGDAAAGRPADAHGSEGRRARE